MDGSGLMVEGGYRMCISWADCSVCDCSEAVVRGLKRIVGVGASNIINLAIYLVTLAVQPMTNQPTN